MKRPILVALLLLSASILAINAKAQERPRARELGLRVGILPIGDRNAITDVPGVLVGEVTAASGDSINTGITAILPHGGNLFRDPVPAAVYVANGFGKMLGIAQVNELGVIETPIVLTCTLCVWKAADALTDQLLESADMADVRSINAIVGETNDGYLNDIRSKPITAEMVRTALASAGPDVDEGSVGAGRGTVAFSWKGGIGTSSRVLRAPSDTFTVGVLVQTNFGGILSIGGAPVGIELGRYPFREFGDEGSADGSIMVVVATDAPLDSRQLQRVARRAMLGVGRTGGAMTNGSGDFVIAFSTDREQAGRVDDGALSPVFQAVAEATEEAIYNSLFKATTVVGHRGTVEAIDIEAVTTILRKYGAID